MNIALMAAFAAQFVFGAYVDDRRLGEHRYDITEDADGLHLKGLAEFRVTVLRVPVFTYHHEVHELWRDGCLVELESTTRSNRQDWAVSGRLENGVFVVERTHNDETARETLESCVATYVYWDPELLLTRTKLLNAQTGLYEPVTAVPTAGTESAPEHIRLTGPNFVIELDYFVEPGRSSQTPEAEDPSNVRWVGLDSVTAEGRRVIYKPVEPPPAKKQP